MFFSSLGEARSAAVSKAVEVGFSKSVLFVDCANGFDPYIVLNYCRDRVLARQVLERVFVSRPFTFYQLLQLVSVDLEKSVKMNCVGDVVVFGFSSLFFDDSRNEEEKFFVLKSVAKSLSGLKERFGVKLHFFVARDKYSEKFWGLFNGSDSAVVSASD